MVQGDILASTSQLPSASPVYSVLLLTGTSQLSARNHLCKPLAPTVVLGTHFQSTVWKHFSILPRDPCVSEGHVCHIYVQYLQKIYLSVSALQERAAASGRWRPTLLPHKGCRLSLAILPADSLVLLPSKDHMPMSLACHAPFCSGIGQG